ncbi:methane monooxygenase PmoA-like [Murinocardiopsis flavida]|uniref:Methane monooxygenase PmoA-like n=1 Tax=Murinocardiopsis flavida TaxID=645275 RepID=A0A2P8DRX7_9ACTN|nr:PmoA family protein [Murinocardiopsis flavida]PSK99968.1 methane monooxygenase PmoA-like [Murinocardiopsis flavida]
MTLALTHAHGDRITVAHEATGTELFAYVYRPEAAWEAPKPYLHPIRTLSGGPVTGYRPNDHRWHKGLQLTASHLSGQNLWGGNTYVHGEGYLPLPEQVGSMAHTAFEEVAAAGDRAVIAERLTWHPHDGALWAEEERRIEVCDVDPASGSWSFTWTSAVTNRRAEPLRFGSPTTHGRPAAGYTGLFWRGPRAFRDGAVFTADGGGELMGAQSPWLAYVGEHDGRDGHATVVFEHAPANDHGGEKGTHPAHWFVRSDPFAAVAPSWAFHEELVLAPGDTLARSYRVHVADGAWDRDRVAAHLAGRAW